MTPHGQVRPQRSIHSIHVATHTHTPVESHVVELDQQCACASAELQLKLVLWF